jgi:hypothetical protein
MTYRTHDGGLPMELFKSIKSVLDVPYWPRVCQMVSCASADPVCAH